MNKQELINTGKTYGLKNKDIESIILNETSLTKSQFFLEDKIEEKHINNIINKFEDYKNGESIEYIIKNTDFYGLNLYIDNRVLIPRNDTEILVQEAIKTINESDINSNKFILIDVGTGSGAIPISIDKNTKNLEKIIAIDISSDVLEVAKINIKNLNLENKIELLNSNLLEKLLNNKNINSNIIITANLPYIKNGDHKNMSKKTINNEPSLALYGGENTGFELYEKLIDQIIDIKKSNSINYICLFIEIGFDQYEYSKKYLENFGFNYEYFKDNSGIYRCIKIEL